VRHKLKLKLHLNKKVNIPAVYLHHKKANKHKIRNYKINKDAIQLLFNWMIVQKRIVK
jgi:hypothetical protein